MGESKLVTQQKARHLIVDIGVSDGADSDFYLKKGFRVVGIEADERVCRVLAERFADPIAQKQYTLVNRAAFSRSGEVLSFFSNQKAQGHSGLLRPGHVPHREGEVSQVISVDWDEIVAQFGIPYFVKVDIEGAEGPSLRSVAPDRNLPKFFSVEAHSFEPIGELYRIGYRNFRLINQTLHHIFEAPNPPREGVFVPDHKFRHSSGLFGEELPGTKWYGFREICELYSAIEKIRIAQTIIGNVWFDCSAVLPEW